MVQVNHVISIDTTPELIISTVNNFVQEAMNQTGYCSLMHQLKLYQSQFEGTIFADSGSLGAQYSYDTNPRMEYYKADAVLGNLSLKDMPGKDIATPSVL
jgi:predicted component of type VI protein secretion system